MNQVRQDVAEENHVLKENMGGQISRVNIRLGDLEKDTEQTVATGQVNELRTQLSQVREGRGRSAEQSMGSVGSNSSHQQVTSGHALPASTEAGGSYSLGHGNERCVEELQVACEASVPV
jgi:hypothetical protein